MRGKLIAKKHIWTVSQAIPAFPQKLTWGYSEHPPKSAPKTTQNSRLMSKSGPFFCKTAQNSRERGKSRATAAQTTQNSRAATDTAQPQASEQNEAGTTKGCRPHVKPFAIAKSRKRGVWVARPSPGETKPASFIAGPSPKSTGRRSVSPPSRGRAPHGQGARPGALTPRSRCAVGARRPGRRRSRRPRTSR